MVSLMQSSGRIAWSLTRAMQSLGFEFGGVGAAQKPRRQARSGCAVVGRDGPALQTRPPARSWRAGCRRGRATRTAGRIPAARTRSRSCPRMRRARRSARTRPRLLLPRRAPRGQLPARRRTRTLGRRRRDWRAARNEPAGARTRGAPRKIIRNGAVSGPRMRRWAWAGSDVTITRGGDASRSASAETMMVVRCCMTASIHTTASPGTKFPSCG